MTSVPATGSLLPAVLRKEVRLLVRHRVLWAVSIVTLWWLGVLTLVDPGTRPTAARWVIALDVMALGFFFAPVMALVERSSGVPALSRLTRLRPWEAQVARLGPMVVLSALSSLVIGQVAGVPDVGRVVIGAGAGGALFALVGLLVLGRGRSFTGFVGRVPLVAISLMLPAIADGLRLVDSPLGVLSPATGALRLILGRPTPAGSGWLMAALGVGWVCSLPLVMEPGRQTPISGLSKQRSTHRRRRPWWAATALDARLLARDRLALMTLAGLPLLFGLVALSLGPGESLLVARGFDPVGHEPVIWGLVVVVHTAVVIGSLLGLLFLEDRDAGLLPAVAMTRLGLRGLVVVRSSVAMAATVVIAGAGSIVAASGAGLVQMAAAAVSAGGLAVVMGLAMTAFARDRVQGIAVMKIAAIPMYAPVAIWFVDGWANRVLSLAPSAWVLRALWAKTPLEAVVWGAVGVGIMAVISGLLFRRMRRELGT